MVKPFGDAVKGLKVGETTTDPVQTQYGWHVIKLVVNVRRAVRPIQGTTFERHLAEEISGLYRGPKKTAKIEKKL